MNSAGFPPAPRPLPPKPKAIRSLRVFVIVFWISVLVITTLVIQEIIATRAAVFIDTFWIVWRGALVIALLIAWHAVRKLLVRRFLAPHAGFVCPSCHYPMRGLAASGSCPECGVGYTRASILSLWEQTYKLGARYPRHVPAAQPHIQQPLVLAEPQTRTPPWIGVSLRTAIDQVTAVAKKKGFVGKTYGAYSLDIDPNMWRVRRVIPTDLHAFYMWFDPDLWNAFVSSGANETGHVRIPVYVRPPHLFQIRTPSGELLPVPTEPTADAPPLVPSREPMLVEFADAGDRYTFAYCLGTDAPPHGAICLIDTTRLSPLALTASLASWLARLAMCDGMEPHINTDAIDFAPMEWREDLSNEIMA